MRKIRAIYQRRINGGWGIGVKRLEEMSVKEGRHIVLYYNMDDSGLHRLVIPEQLYGKHISLNHVKGREAHCVLLQYG